MRKYRRKNKKFQELPLEELSVVSELLQRYNPRGSGVQRVKEGDYTSFR